MGDSRGHWEGNTLVVDVTNNNSKGRLSRAGDFASDKLHVTERFEFLDADHMQYRAVFDDPSTYTRPWTFGFDMKRAIFGETTRTRMTRITSNGKKRVTRACSRWTIRCARSAVRTNRRCDETAMFCC